MTLSDPIGDMLTRIRNAGMAGAEYVEMPYSRLKDSIARLLKREGYIVDYTAEGGGVRRVLRLYLKYTPDRKAVIQGLRRISRPGLRRYIAAASLRPVRSGLGMAIISTSRGLMTDREARRQNVGGEWLCSVW